MFSQAVGLIEVAKAPAVVRMKFIRPAAEAVSCGSTALSAKLVVGMKKNGIAKPWARMRQGHGQKSMLEAKLDRDQRDAGHDRARRNETRTRGSTLPMSRATIGDITTASTPCEGCRAPRPGGGVAHVGLQPERHQHHGGEEGPVGQAHDDRRRRRSRGGGTPCRSTIGCSSVSSQIMKEAKPIAAMHGQARR